jgi:hypothetical protein
LRVQPKLGGKFLLTLNTNSKPIVYKYRKGKVQRTLKRGLKVLEIVEMEGIVVSSKEIWIRIRG